MDDLVKGVRLSRAGESLETCRTPGMTVQLLASWDGTEVIRQIVPRGKRFALRPEEGWNALECLVILDGTAVWENGSRSVTVGPGDTLSATPVQEPCMLVATTDVTALYICSQPIFHQVSQELSNLRGLAVAVEIKDGYTADHCSRIQRLSLDVGAAMNLDPGRMFRLNYGSFFHDLGKTRVPIAILNKPGPLTSEEWNVMRCHATWGHDLLQPTWMREAAVVPLQHHERWGGSGYPQGLIGDEIAVEAQIVAVVDSYDAMTTNRSYRAAMPHDKAVEELRSGAGRLYRPDVVEAFLSVAHKFQNPQS